MQIPVVMGGAKQLDPAAMKKFHDGIGFLDTMIADRAYAAGPHLTIADIALVASISSIDVSCCLCLSGLASDSHNCRETESIYVIC
jgi:glutathione S-transferase